MHQGNTTIAETYADLLVIWVCNAVELTRGGVLTLSNAILTCSGVTALSKELLPRATGVVALSNQGARSMPVWWHDHISIFFGSLPL